MSESEHKPRGSDVPPRNAIIHDEIVKIYNAILGTKGMKEHN